MARRAESAQPEGPDGRRLRAERTYIVSDLHLGCEFFYREQFLSWLRQLPPGARLVLNGDVLDDPREPLPPAHQHVLAELVEASRQRPVVWVRGNHDDGQGLAECGCMEFTDRWIDAGRLMAVHGDFLDDIMPRHGLFKWLFRRVHRLRVALGARRVHVAQYAKRWRFLYEVLERHVARNAARAARELGYPAIVCGHTHAPADRIVDGVRYLNTGAWTEEPLHYLRVDPEEIRLEEFHGQVE